MVSNVIPGKTVDTFTNENVKRCIERVALVHAGNWHNTAEAHRAGMLFHSNIALGMDGYEYKSLPDPIYSSII